ncbi:MAG: hypothetical protein AAF998_25535 [Bacteroidota bacterium]
MKDSPKTVYRTCEGWLKGEWSTPSFGNSRSFFQQVQPFEWTDPDTGITRILTEDEAAKIDEERQKIWKHQFGILFEAERKKFEKRHKASLEGEKLRVDTIEDIKRIFDRTFHPEPLDQIRRNVSLPPPIMAPYFGINKEFILPVLPKVSNHKIWDMREADRMATFEDFQPYWIIQNPAQDVSQSAMMRAEVYKALARWLEFSYLRWEGNPNMYHPIGIHAANIFHEDGYVDSMALADPIRYIAMPTESNRAIYLNRWGISSKSGLTALSIEEINVQVRSFPDPQDRIKLLFKIREAYDVNELVMFNLDKPVYRSLIRAMFDAWPKINHERFIQWWNEISGWNGPAVKTATIQPPETKPAPQPKSEILYQKLRKYQFFGLPKVRILSDEAKVQLIGIISSANLPFQIALLDHLEFITYLEKEHTETKQEARNVLGGLLGASERNVKGNIYVLNPKSKENRKRYTAHLQVQKAIEEFEKLK